MHIHKQLQAGLSETIRSERPACILYIPAETPLFFPAQTKYKADMAHHCTQRTVMLAHDMKTLFQRSFVVAGSHPLAQVINQHEMSIMQ